MSRGLLLFGAMLVTAMPALAAKRQVEIVNATPHAMVRLYVLAADRDDGEDDVLGDRILKPGQSVRIDMNDGSDVCLFDVRADLDDGKTLTRRKINACEMTTYRLTDR